MKNQKRENFAGQLVRAACQVIEERVGHGIISKRLVTEFYLFAIRALNQMDFHKVPNDYENRETLERFVVDSLPIGFFMTAIVHREVKACFSPEIIECFRQALPSVLRAPALQGSAKAEKD
ncbi:MAG: hypothetical protein ACE5JQ_12310 [Candidatus Methylomirabilales bacterium]